MSGDCGHGWGYHNDGPSGPCSKCEELAPKYGYVCFYNEKRWEVYAKSLFAAQLAAAQHFNVSSKRRHLIHVVLAEFNGNPVVHVAD